MNKFNIDQMKSNLQIINLQDNTPDYRQPLHIEITITNACNMNCKYCFERNHVNLANHIEENRQLHLIENLCKDFDTTKFNGLQIVFWGGEPMLNIEFMKKIIIITAQYEFVVYFMYSNGTLLEQYAVFFNDILIKSIKHRFRIQLSYDGDPINKIERGIDKDKIIKTAHFLQDNGFSFSFKATVSSKTIRYMPNAWKSFEELYEEFNCDIKYAPTIDMTSDNISSVINDWENAITQIMVYEYYFFKKHHTFLLSWLNYDNFNDNKLICNKDYTCHLHTDGNIYICHGCPYLDQHEKFKLGTTNTINTLYDVLKKYQHGKRDDKCFDCVSVFCNFCHLYHVNPNDIHSTWLSSINNNKDRCYCFKYAGMMKKLLDYILIDYNLHIK